MMERVDIENRHMEEPMRKVLSLVISLVLIISVPGCSKKTHLDIKSFEKYCLSDLGLEKTVYQEGDEAYGYYDMDDKIDNTDASQMKRDHYVQVYSKATNNTIGNLYMIYTDYQVADEARNYFNELSSSKRSEISNDPEHNSVDAGDDYLLTVSSKDGLTYRFECLYIKDDVILFAAIILSASEFARMDAPWLKKIDDLFDDLHIRSPFPLVPDIEALIK